MSHAEDLKALREEVAKLRERIAVLEARPVLKPFVGPAPTWHGDPHPFPYRVVPMTVTEIPPPYRIGDAPGWWQDGPTALGN